MACRCGCGELYIDAHFMTALQELRNEINAPLRVNSAHRCWRHNARVGGAPLSRHRTLAVDLDLRGHNRRELAQKAEAAGFTGRGYYQNFLHLDRREIPYVWWSGPKARRLWAS